MFIQFKDFVKAPISLQEALLYTIYNIINQLLHFYYPQHFKVLNKIIFNSSDFTL